MIIRKTKQNYLNKSIGARGSRGAMGARGANLVWAKKFQFDH